MKSATRLVVSLLLAGLTVLAAGAETLRQNVLRDAAVDGGLVPAEATQISQSENLVTVGKELFESKLLSLNRDVACASCHLDQFGSADGLPVAIGTEGEGVGVDRILNGGDIVPRNALPFWGRGGRGFDILFWDGKVDGSTGSIVSQFGDASPSDDPLVVAVHLPPAEIGEMVIDQQETQALQTEDVETARLLYAKLAARIREVPELAQALSKASGTPVDQLQFIDIAKAIAAFIRVNFRVKSTRFHKFVFESGDLTEVEVRGGLLFYGRAKCVSCHNGPYFSDLEFHSIPFPQLGSGRNGFGVDYGRFNVTLNESDRYRFRTPPLYNVISTSPYSHSGSIYDLGDAIRVHTDPLVFIEPQKMSTVERVEYYERLEIWSDTPMDGVVLDEGEISAIKAFLGTLSFPSDTPVNVVD